MKSLPLPEILALLLAAAVAGPSLLDSWAHAPFERWSAAGFLLWASPLAWLGFKIRKGPPSPAGEAGSRGFPLLTGAALAFLVLGALLDFHVLRHAAFACAIAGLFPSGPRTFIWLLTAAAWMPFAGWLLKSWPWEPATALRLCLCAAGASAVLIRKPRPAPLL